MKIAIITITKSANLGNVLQNFALQKVINDCGYEVETIKNLTGSLLFVDNRRTSLKNWLQLLFNYHGYRRTYYRNRIFRLFCNDNIKYGEVTYNNGVFSGPYNYDLYIVGSDQVWNPCFGLATDYELLNYFPFDRCGSYAASFGISDFNSISIDKKEHILESLLKFRSISVREDSGKNIIENLVGVPCYVHLDPTMLLTGSDWRKYELRPSGSIPGKYIIVYLLGHQTDEYKSKIRMLSNRMGASIVDLFDNKWFNLNPFEFLWMIENAACICTDSFHAVVFSILYHKQFFIFKRVDDNADQSSRFYTLLNTCGIKQSQCDIDNTIETINWDEVDTMLETKRSESMAYIHDLLNGAK